MTHDLLLFYLATCDKALFVCILYPQISSFRARDLEGTRLGGVIASGREDSEVPKKWLLNTEELLCVQGAAELWGEQVVIPLLPANSLDMV